MAKKSKRQKSKARRPKGKPLSQALREKDEAREELERQLDEEEELDSLAEAALAEDAPLDADDDADTDDASDAEDEDEDELDDDDSPFDDDDEPQSGEVDEEDGDEEDGAPLSGELDEDDEFGAAAQMGHQRYVMAGFFGLWIVVSYILGQVLELAWSRFASTDWFVANVPQLAAVPHEGELVSRASVSLVLGGVIGAGIVLRYYLKPDIRTWADEVAEELTHVKWPNRKEVGNHTVVVIIASGIITLYLWLLDQFWMFATNLIYQSGA